LNHLRELLAFDSEKSAGQISSIFNRASGGAARAIARVAP
jgi:hypothetical protein